MIYIKNILKIIAGFILIKIVGIGLSNLFNLHYLDGQFLTYGLIIALCSFVAIINTNKFAINTSNKIETRLIKILGIIMLSLGIFMVFSSFEKLELEKIYCENLVFKSKGVNSPGIIYSCNGRYVTSYSGYMETDCSYDLFTKKNTGIIYEFDKIECHK